jgi:3-oxoadipate enol-lactonase
MAVFQNNGIGIYYEDLGDRDSGRCVAFLNGVMASANSWSFLYPVFERMGWRIVLHDFKGQLKSDKPPGPYTFKEHAGDAKALFDHLGIRRLHLVGTSYGGEVAMKFAIEYPEAAASITVIDSVSKTDSVLRGFIDSWKFLCDTGDGEAFFLGIAPSIYGQKFLAENHEMLSKRAKAIKNNPNGFLEGQKILYDTFVDDIFMTDQLCRIQCPALVICGENDILKPVKFSGIIADNIPGSEFMTIPDCGHVAIFEKPKELESAILGFVMKHENKLNNLS